VLTGLKRRQITRLAGQRGRDICYQHVQAIIVAIDQYAEKALGNREFFLNKPALEVEGTITFPDSYRSKRERKLSVAGTR
jgi:hypothetical protein